MIAVDTNVLARFYVNDPGDPEAVKQRPIARRVISESPSLFVPQSVIVELEWVLRAFYGFCGKEFDAVITHLMGLPNVRVEEWPRVLDAVALHRAGMDLADALHLLTSGHCKSLLTFDDRRFARKAKRLGVKPEVRVPSE